MRALIIGAGMAGPVTAMALQQAGIERRHRRGASADGRRGRVVLHGLAQRARRAGGGRCAAGRPGHRLADIAATSCATALAGVLGDMPLGYAARGRDAGADDEALAARTRPRRRGRARGIRIDYGRRLVDATRVGEVVVATFEDGSTETGGPAHRRGRCPLVVRRLIDPAAPGGRYVGLTNFGGITPAGSVGVPDIEPETWQFGFGRHAFFGAQRASNGDVIWFVNAPRPDDLRRGAGRDVVRDVAGDVGGALRRRPLAGRRDSSARATSSLPATTRTTSAMCRSWHRDRMIVIGDAAHAPAPSSGQGASMALEDAVIARRWRCATRRRSRRRSRRSRRPDASGSSRSSRRRPEQQHEDAGTGRQPVPRRHHAGAVPVGHDRAFRGLDVRPPDRRGNGRSARWPCETERLTLLEGSGRLRRLWRHCRLRRVGAGWPRASRERHDSRPGEVNTDWLKSEWERTRRSKAPCAASTRRSSRAASSPRLADASTTRSPP